MTRLRYVVASKYFENNDFGGIYCNTNRAFAPSEWGPSREMKANILWDVIFRNTEVELPKVWNYPCCGTFFVSADSIRTRPRKVYEQILLHMANASMHYRTHRICGRVVESAWKHLFAPDAVYQPPPDCSNHRMNNARVKLTGGSRLKFAPEGVALWRSNPEG